MRRPTVAVVVVAVAVVAVALWWSWWMSKPSVPSPADDVLARLLNSTDADVRSLELARWFVAKLRAQLPTGPTPCGKVADVFDYGAIADAVPGINHVSKRETVRNLRALVAQAGRQACDGAFATRAALVGALERSLRGLRGPYPEKSRTPLPR